MRQNNKTQAGRDLTRGGKSFSDTTNILARITTILNINTKYQGANMAKAKAPPIANYMMEMVSMKEIAGIEEIAKPNIDISKIPQGCIPQVMDCVMRWEQIGRNFNRLSMLVMVNIVIGVANLTGVSLKDIANFAKAVTSLF